MMYFRLKLQPTKRTHDELLSIQSCSSDASDASSITAEHGSPPRQREVYNDENYKHISNWAKDIAPSDIEDEPHHRDPRKCSYALFNS